MKLHLPTPNLLVTHPTNIAYLTGYFSPTPTERDVTLLLTPKTKYLYCSILIYDQLKHLPGWKVIPFRSRAELPKLIKPRRLGFEPHHLTVAEAKTFSQTLIPTNHLIENLRTIKNPTEIRHIRSAYKLTIKVFAYLQPLLTPGRTEAQLAWLAEKFLRDNGADGLAFPVIIASGPNSSVPHHTTSNRKLAKNDIVIIDIGCKVSGYCSDMTRTFFVGQPSLQMLKVEQIVKSAHTAALSTIYDLPSTISVDRAARHLIETAGYGQYFIHGTGHGLGLDIHESPSISPVSKDKLQPHMTITIEPGIYLPHKFGYRHEDTVLITPTGHSLLTV